MRSPRAPILVTALAVALLMAAGLNELPPPTPLAPTNDQQVSPDRAMQHVRAIATHPHPTGSPANAAVRQYLVTELSTMGLEPQLQPTTRRSAKDAKPATLVNVLARLPGTRPGPAVMLAAHYDSVPTGPGAGDDACAVGALLETMRALRAGPPLRNDVILLITDGEELGLLGARAFVDKHPWAKDVGVVLNFDNRGAGGPEVLFETSVGNAGLIRQVAAAAPVPFATSAAYDVYRHMPNGTDLTVFRSAGMMGCGFACIGRFAYYHTPADTPQHLDPRTLYHTATYALPLARQFGNADLAALRADRDTEGDDVYFNVWRGVLVRYPARLAWALTALVVVLAGAAIVVAFHRRTATLRGLIGSMLRMTIGIAICAGCSYTLSIWLTTLRQRSTLDHRVTVDLVSILLFIAVCVALTLVAALWRRRPGEHHRVATLTAGTLILTTLTAVAPGVSYLAAWPMLFLAVQSLVLPLSSRLWLPMLTAVITATPICLLIVPLTYLLYVALTIRLAAALAPVVSAATWLLLTACVLPLTNLANHAGSAAEVPPPRPIDRTVAPSLP